MNGLELKTVGEIVRELEYSKKNLEEHILQEKEKNELDSLKRQLNYVNGQISGIKRVIESIITLN